MKKCDYVQFLDRLVTPCILPLVLVTADPASFPALMRLWHHASTASQSLLDKIGRTGFAVSSESSTPATKWPKYDPSARQTIFSYCRSWRRERRPTQHDYKHKCRLLAGSCTLRFSKPTGNGNFVPLPAAEMSWQGCTLPFVLKVIR